MTADTLRGHWHRPMRRNVYTWRGRWLRLLRRVRLARVVHHVLPPPHHTCKSLQLPERTYKLKGRP